MLEKDENIREGQAGFRLRRSCVDHADTWRVMIRERKCAGLPTYCFFLDVQEARDTVEKYSVETLQETAIRGKVYRMMEKMTLYRKC